MNRFKELFALDRRSLGLFRIGMGLVLLADLVLRARFLTAHYTDAGVLPRPDLIETLYHPAMWSLHFAGGTAWFIGGLFVLNAILVICFLIGYRWRIAGLLSWLLLISLQVRNPAILSGADVMLRVMLFWGLFLPLGERFALNTSRTPSPPVVSIASACYIAQLLAVYVFNFAHKQYPHWHDGQAVWQALMLDQFTTPVGDWLVQFPSLTELLTYGVLGLEVIGPVVLLIPFFHTIRRCLIVGSFVLFHIGLMASMNLGLFPAIAIVAWLPLLPSGIYSTSTASNGYSGGRFGYGDLWRWVINTFMVVMIVIVLMWNAAEHNKTIGQWVRPADPVVYTLRLDQNWTMFAPYPSRNDGWVVIEATFRDGTNGDIYHGGPVGEPRPLRFQKPDDVSATYMSNRWRKYLINLRAQKYKRYRHHYGQYICDVINQGQSGSDRLWFIKIYTVIERTKTRTRTEHISKKKLLQKVSCFDRPDSW